MVQMVQILKYIQIFPEYAHAWYIYLHLCDLDLYGKCREIIGNIPYMDLRVLVESHPFLNLWVLPCFFAMNATCETTAVW